MPIALPVVIQTLKISDGGNRTVYYPAVVQMDDPKLEHDINRTIAGHTQQLINRQYGDMSSPVVEMLGSYEIKNNQRQVLSLSLSNYAYHAQAAHGMTYIDSLTFDLQKGTLVQLKDLFKPGSDYVARLSAIIRQQIKQREIPLLREFTTIRPDQDFYIADKALVIYFQLYDLTPYVYGFPMFPISVYEIQDIILESGPLGRMAVND